MNMNSLTVHCIVLINSLHNIIAKPDLPIIATPLVEVRNSLPYSCTVYIRSGGAIIQKISETIPKIITLRQMLPIYSTKIHNTPQRGDYVSDYS